MTAAYVWWPIGTGDRMEVQGIREKHDQELSQAHTGTAFGSAATIKRPKKSPGITEIPAVLGLLLLPASSGCDRSMFNSEVTQQNIAQSICVPGYAKAVRPPTYFTSSLKQKLLKRAGRDETEDYKYKLDYIVTPALGGHPRKVENFELARRDGASSARRKNRIEAKLQCLVCSGEMTLADAQREVSRDWQAAYQRYAPVKCRHPKG